MFAMHEIHSANGQLSKYVYVHIPSSVIETFTVDAKLDIIYFVDSRNNVLKKHDIKSRQNSVLTSVFSAKGILFMYISRAKKKSLTIHIHRIHVCLTQI